jgi:hypothetical protein
MKKLRILMAGGLTQDKFQKKVKELEEILKKLDIVPVISTVNTYEQKDLSSFEEDNDLILTMGTLKLESKLPVIDGMGLMYGWMNRDKMIEEIVKVNN